MAPLKVSDVTEIRGKTIVITGGASGIGRLVALKLARLGGRVVIWDIDAARLDRVVAELTVGRPAPGSLRLSCATCRTRQQRVGHGRARATRRGTGAASWSTVPGSCRARASWT